MQWYSSVAQMEHKGYLKMQVVAHPWINIFGRLLVRPATLRFQLKACVLVRVVTRDKDNYGF